MAADSNIVNVMRRILLRLRPYMSGGAETQPEIAYKSLQILDNLAHFLADKSMTVENKAVGTFSAEDGPNVLIPCCLSATAFEIYDNFKKILETENFNYFEQRLRKNYQIKLTCMA